MSTQSEHHEHEQFALGWDFSTQQVKAIGIGLTTGDILFEEFLKFDDALPHYNTKGGVHVHADGLTVTSPVLMWVEALEAMLGRLRAAGVDLGRVAVVCGSGQQHGSVYWRRGARAALAGLQSGRASLAEQLAGCFSSRDSPVWMDASTGEQCRALEDFAGGAEKLAALTGARAFHRYTASQLMKQRQAGILADTERVSLVSSFAASLFLGDYAAIDEADASGMNLMSLAERRWVPELCEFVSPGLEALLGPVVPGRTILGRVAPYLVSGWGFSPDCRVAAFTGDNPATLAGLRLRPGSLAVTLGSSSCAFLWVTGRHLPPGTALPSLGCVVMACAVDSNACMPIVVLKNGALTREAIRDEFAGGSWSTFDALLDASPPGNSGKIGLYYDAAEIVPEGAHGRYRFDANGQLLLPPSSATFAEASAEVRACVESHAATLSHYAQALGFEPGGGASVLVTGGASANRRILQILADVFAAPVAAQRDSRLGNSAALGAALIGASALQPGLDFHAALPPLPRQLDCWERLEPTTAADAAAANRQLRQRLPGLMRRAVELTMEREKRLQASSD